MIAFLVYLTFSVPPPGVIEQNSQYFLFASPVNHTTPDVVHVISCCLNITMLLTRFHTAHLNPVEGRSILNAVVKFSQDLCLPLW